MDGPFKTPRGPSKLSSKYKRTLASNLPDQSIVLAGNLGSPSSNPCSSRWESTINHQRRRLKSNPNPILSESSIIPGPGFQELDGLSIFTEDQTLYHSAREELESSPDLDSNPPLDAQIFFSVGKRRSLAFQRRQQRPILASDSEEEDVLPRNRRQSVLGRNPVILLTSESDSDEEDPPQIPPPALDDRAKERQVGQWVRTSPFQSPQTKRLSDFEPAQSDAGIEENGESQESPIESEATSKRLSWADNCEGFPKKDCRSFSHQTSFPTILDESSCSSHESDSVLTNGKVSKALQVSLTTEDGEEDKEEEDDTLLTEESKENVVLETSSVETEPLDLHLTLSTQNSPPPPVKQRSTETVQDSSSPEEESRFQQFLQKLKREREQRALREENNRRPIEDFLVNDSGGEALIPIRSPPKTRYFQEPIVISSSDEDSEPSTFKVKSWTGKSTGTRKKRVSFSDSEDEETQIKPKRSDDVPIQKTVILLSDSDEDDKENELLDIPPPKVNPEKVVKPKKPARTPKAKTPVVKPKIPKPNVSTLGFMESLSLPYANERCHPDATKYLSKFQTHRDELARKLYKLFNEQIFAMSLPTDMELTWSPRLRRTAGRCWQRSKLIRGELERFSSIELSTKVLDSSDRLRDTLIHEMCHAAAWIISGYRDGHGQIWKDWAKRSMREFPELPIINRCHNYAIRTKFTYRCVKCGYQFGRHSKSLDTERKVCGLCRGKFELLVNRKAGPNTETPGRRVEPTTPRTPNKFALFVKENYKHVRLPGVDHKDAMKMLSSQFALTKIS